MLNLLSESFIRFDSVRGERVSASLPEVYAALMADEVASFPALRPHQRHAWHAFLVQLGAIAMHRAGLDGEPPHAPDAWVSLIRNLTPEHPEDEPWCLAIDDLTMPAFLQPPATSGELISDYKKALETPGQLDMLVTSKNHALKSTVARTAGADDWLFALITVQTMDGYPGSGLYGISRMNGGYANRPAFSMAPIGGIGRHVRRDIVALLDKRTAILTDNPLSEQGAALLWTLPWDGSKGEALLIKSLDPFYIEVCRRVRLRSSAAGKMSAVRATSKKARVEVKELKGRTGDPWMPINSRENKALSLSGGGFTYRRVIDYLDPLRYSTPYLFSLTEAERLSGEPVQLVARSLAHSDRKSHGYHERIVPFREPTTRAFASPSGVEGICEIAKVRITRVGIVQRALRDAIYCFLKRGEDRRDDVKDRRRDQQLLKLCLLWEDRLDSIVDASFFEALQDELEANDSQRQTIQDQWLLGVVDSARELLRDACDTLPCRTIHRYRARTRAESLFEGRLRGNNGLPFLFAGDQR